jgi:hypothetical protein
MSGQNHRNEVSIHDPLCRLSGSTFRRNPRIADLRVEQLNKYLRKERGLTRATDPRNLQKFVFGARRCRKMNVSRLLAPIGSNPSNPVGGQTVGR